MGIARDAARVYAATGDDVAACLQGDGFISWGKRWTACEQETLGTEDFLSERIWCESRESGQYDFATVSFIESEIQAEQQRTTAIVQTSDKGGYYIDVFRSRKKEGGDKTHDYFYHNLGQEMKVMDAASDKALDMKPTEELAFAGDHLYAYSYIYNKVSAEMTSSVKTQVDENRTIDRYQSGKKNVAFLMHSMGHHPACSEIDASIIYADYYYLEALNRAKKIAF